MHFLGCMLYCSSLWCLSVQIGGLWVLNNDSGRSACYDSLRINTSKLVTRFHDFPVPKHYRCSVRTKRWALGRLNLPMH